MGGGIYCVEVASSEERRAGLKGEDGSKATVSPLSTPSSTSTLLLQEVLLNCSLYSPLSLPAPVVNSEIGE